MLYKLDPLSALFGFEQVCLFHGLVALFSGPLDVFIGFHLFSERFTSIGNDCFNSYLWDMPSAAAFMAFLKGFSAW